MIPFLNPKSAFIDTTSKVASWLTARTMDIHMDSNASFCHRPWHDTDYGHQQGLLSQLENTDISTGPGRSRTSDRYMALGGSTDHFHLHGTLEEHDL